MISKKAWIGVISFLGCFITQAQIPTGYYTSIEGTEGDELKEGLYSIIKGHIEYSYTSSSTDTWDILKEADQDPANSDNVIGIYSGFSMNGAKEYNSGAGWSREHVWAKSRGDFGTTKGAGTECHHLRAEDVSTNTARSNRNFDECSVQYIDASGATDSYTSDTEFVWKPRDEVKGDVARMMFYMATRYEGENDEPDLELTEMLLELSDKSPIHGRLSVLINWHFQDPVSEAERDRNEVIYSYQNNRNPFIDHPEFAELIWGGVTGIASNKPKIVIDQRNEKINIEAPTHGLIRLINMQGKEFTRTLSADPMVISTTTLPSGIYILTFATKFRIDSFKILIRR